MASSSDYRERFKSCGEDVVIEPGVYIEHPESWVVGDRVRLMRNFTALDKQAEVRLGDDTAFYPNSFIRGKGRLIVGERVGFYVGTYMELGDIEVGSKTHFAPYCILYGGPGLKIGECCGIATHTVFATVAHDHRVLDRPMVETFRSAPITLVRDVWIGANATVVGGVTIAEGCVIGAGAVLTRDTEPYGVYLGVPARFSHARDPDAPASFNV